VPCRLISGRFVSEHARQLIGEFVSAATRASLDQPPEAKKRLHLLIDDVKLEIILPIVT